MELEDDLEPQKRSCRRHCRARFTTRSPNLTARRVYGIAGVLMTGDALASFTRNIGQGFRQAGTSTPEEHPTREGTPQGQRSQA